MEILFPNDLPMVNDPCQFKFHIKMYRNTLVHINWKKSQKFCSILRVRLFISRLYLSAIKMCMMNSNNIQFNLLYIATKTSKSDPQNGMEFLPHI